MAEVVRIPGRTPQGVSIDRLGSSRRYRVRVHWPAWLAAREAGDSDARLRRWLEALPAGWSTDRELVNPFADRAPDERSYPTRAAAMAALLEEAPWLARCAPPPANPAPPSSTTRAASASSAVAAAPRQPVQWERFVIGAPRPPRRYIIDGLPIARRCLTMVHAREDVGKSLLVLDLAVAVVTGRPAWYRLPVRERGRVVVLALDGDPNLWPERAERIARADGIDARSLGAAIDIARPKALRLDHAGAERALIERVADATLMIVDCLAAGVTGTYSEIDPSAGQVAYMLGRVAAETDCAAVLLHHDSQSGGPRGSTSLVAAVDARLALTGGRGKPIQVRDAKLRLTGRASPALTVDVVDVELDGDPRGGLRVVAREPGKPQTERSRSVAGDVQVDEEARRVILGAVASGGYPSQHKAIANLKEQRCGIGGSRLSAAWRALEGAGRIAKPSDAYVVIEEGTER